MADINIKGMIFDMDGVVVDSMSMWRSVLPGLSEELGIEIDDELNSQIQAMSIAISAQFIVDKFDLDVTAEEIIEKVNRKITAYYMNYATLKPGAHDLMPIIRMNQIKVCLATATPKNLASAALNKNDIREAFPKIITVGEIGKGKAEPDIFEAALDYLGTAPEETLVVEDSDIAIRTAHGLGMKTCAVYDGVNDSILDKVSDIVDIKIRSLDELIAYI